MKAGFQYVWNMCGRKNEFMIYAQRKFLFRYCFSDENVIENIKIDENM